VERFFDRPDTHWRRRTECLHVYAVPSPASSVRKAFDTMASRLSKEPGLGHQPGEHVHMTVQRLDAFRPELDKAALDTLAELLTDAAASIQPFELEFDAPIVTSHAIQAIATTTDSWRHLTAVVRSAVGHAGLADALTEPPSAPHFTLAYATAHRVDDEIAPIVRSVGVPSVAEVRSVCLVSVDQDPERGAFTFVVLQEFPLGR
jgi:2'-5' RNA ligase